jgi:FKBP-type peptidyl-prolyl cis-trans isomerase FklB
MLSSRSLLFLTILSLLFLVPSFVDGDEVTAREKVGRYNARMGERYLKNKELVQGMKKLESGILYRQLQRGKGKVSPGPNDQVKVHYAGTLITGEEFDSSYARGTPATFGVNGVIKGWTEVLQLMRKDDIWEVHIPSHLAYGESGSGKLIGPNAVLVFKIELLEVITDNRDEL